MFWSVLVPTAVFLTSAHQLDSYIHASCSPLIAVRHSHKEMFYDQKLSPKWIFNLTPRDAVLPFCHYRTKPHPTAVTLKPRLHQLAHALIPFPSRTGIFLWRSCASSHRWSSCSTIIHRSWWQWSSYICILCISVCEASAQLHHTIRVERPSIQTEADIGRQSLNSWLFEPAYS